MNKVTARGRIANIYRDERGNTTFSLTIVRRNRVDEMNFVYMGTLPPDIKSRDHVAIDGHVVSYRRRGRDGAPGRNVQYFVADKVERMKPFLEEMFGRKGYYYEPDFFVACFKGTVVNVVNGGPKFGKLIIETEKEGKEPGARAALSYYKGGRLPRIEGIQESDIVSAVCNIFTPEPEEGKEGFRFEDLTVEDAIVTKAAKTDKPAKEDAPAEEKKPLFQGLDRCSKDN